MKRIDCGTIQTTHWSLRFEGKHFSITDIACISEVISFLYIKEERVNLSSFSPVCLPSERHSFEDEVGHIYGGFWMRMIMFSSQNRGFSNWDRWSGELTILSGWGIGDLGFGATILQEAQVKTCICSMHWKVPPRFRKMWGWRELNRVFPHKFSWQIPYRKDTKIMGERTF